MEYYINKIKMIKEQIFHEEQKKRLLDNMVNEIFYDKVNNLSDFNKLELIKSL